MSALPLLPNDDPKRSVSQSNNSGHNINIAGYGHIVHVGVPHQPLSQTNDVSPAKLKEAYAPTENDSKQSEYIDKDRINLLNSVYRIWIQGVLSENLKTGTMKIDKDLLRMRPATNTSSKNYQFNPSAPITQIYWEMGKQLVILGDPGSGKTVMMLQLLKDLLDRSRSVAAEPIPVVLNLSSWTAGASSLTEWIASELFRLYNFPKGLAKDWIKQEKFIFLLDDLDQVTAELGVRQACVDAINKYQHEHTNLRPETSISLVICCRTSSYSVLKRPLTLNGAICPRRLTQEQIFAYLVDGSAGVQDLIANEQTAYEMAQLPLLLNVMKTTYAEEPYRGSPFWQLEIENATMQKRRDHLLSKYLDKQVRYVARFSPHLTLHYLQWLAYQMVRPEVDTSVFYIEDLQPMMLEQPNRFKKLLKRVMCILSAFSIALIVGPFVGLVYKPLAGLVGGFIAGLVAGVTTKAEKELEKIGLVKRFNKSFGATRLISKKNISLLFSLIYRLCWASIATIFLGLILGMFLGPLLNLDDWLIFSVPGLLIVTRYGGIFEGINTERNSGYRSGGKELNQRGMQNILIIESDPLSRRINGQNLGSGLRANINYMLFIWLGVGLSLGLAVGLVSNVIAGLLIGFSVGLLAGLGIGGGDQIIKHFMLRYSLACEGAMPFQTILYFIVRYPLFLDHMASIGLLRKVGGGYMFRHRMLMEYLSEQYKKDRHTTPTTVQ